MSSVDAGVPIAKKLRWHLETLLFLGGSRLLSWLPDRAVVDAGKWLGRFFFLLLKRRREIAIRNISESLWYLERQPGWVEVEAQTLARACFENLGRSVVEECRIYHGRGDDLIASVEMRGMEHFEAALARGKGVAFVTGHCGNWELMALSFGVRCQSISVVARRQDNRDLNAVLEKIRSGYGNTIFYREGAVRSMLACFRKNGVVGLLMDQAVMPEDGVLVDFLGRPAWTSNVVALMARKAQVPLVPAFIHREGGRHVMTFSPELTLSPDPGDATEDTQILTRAIECYVIEHPAEWYWIHKRWKRVPDWAARADGGDDA